MFPPHTVIYTNIGGIESFRAPPEQNNGDIVRRDGAAKRRRRKKSANIAEL